SPYDVTVSGWCWAQTLLLHSWAQPRLQGLCPQHSVPASAACLSCSSDCSGELLVLG
ncbi:hypothetical protein NDU88_000094, partial [Pleurodeles waltl]